MTGTRIGEKEMGTAPYWADSVADYLIHRYPKKRKFVCAAGISPSGPIHFGNFREIATTFAVVQALKDKGKEAELIFSWDNFDRFRKVPKDIDQTYEEHIGKPLSAVPSPDGHGSYADEYQKEFEETMQEFSIPITYKNQTELYTAGTYDEHIITAMQKREHIARILLRHMTDKGKELKGISDETYIKNYYPISVYSRFTGKDATEILSYNGESTITYRCKITKKEEEIDFTKTRIVKLSWKVDWAMRWMYEDVCFEPAGSDHSAPGGSYDVSSAIIKEIFNAEAPVFTEFGFVGLQGLGTKMSGSSGKNVTPKTLLSIYEPRLLLWMYLRRLPRQTFSLAFDTEVYRQYDEMDAAFQPAGWLARLLKKSAVTITDGEKRIVETLKKLYPKDGYKQPVPFRQLVGLGQTVQWDEKKLHELLRITKETFSTASLQTRLPKAKAWVMEYNRDMIVKLRTEPNKKAWENIDEIKRQYIQKLCDCLQQSESVDISKLENVLYSLPKEHHDNEKELKKAQRQLFTNLYQLLIDRDTGPRLSTFIWAASKERVLPLITHTHQ